MPKSIRDAYGEALLKYGRDDERVVVLDADLSGSTKSGIAPFYSDKYAKIGFQVCELFDEEGLREKLERVCATKNVLMEHLYHKPLLDVDELYNTMMEYKEMIAP